MFTVDNPSNRFGTSIMDNKTLIKQTLYEKNLQSSFEKLSKRTENAAKYYNQHFKDIYSPSEDTKILLQTNRSIEKANDSQHSFRGGYNPSTSPINDLQRSISKIRDRGNEVFINDENELESARRDTQNHKLRLSLGVFGDFQVATLPQVQSVNQTSHLQKRLIFRTMDKNQYGSNTLNQRENSYNNSRAQTGITTNVLHQI